MNFYEFEKILQEAKKVRIVPNPNRDKSGFLKDPSPIKKGTWKEMPKELKEKLAKQREKLLDK